VSNWLRQCTDWQYGLVWVVGMVTAVVGGGSVGQWLWRGHLNPSGLAGSAVGAMLVVPSWFSSTGRAGRRLAKAQPLIAGTRGSRRESARTGRCQSDQRGLIAILRPARVSGLLLPERFGRGRPQPRYRSSYDQG
jgi:hypothetical protein